MQAILAGCLLIAAFAFVIFLRLDQASAPMSADEYASMYFSERSFRELWGWWMVRETNPPLFYSLLKLWRLIVPPAEWTLRLLPLLLSLAQIALLARIAGKAYGWMSAVLCVVMFALSPSDIFQSEYLRGYVLAKLAATVSFAGLLVALSGGRHRLRGLTAYAGGAVVAIYSHTTMLLWPPIATCAVLIELASRRKRDREGRSGLAGLLWANLAIVAFSSWVLWIAVAQLRHHASNISWIQPLSLEDYVSSVDLQLLLDSTNSSAAMIALMALGILRTARNRVTRLSLLIVLGTLLAYKAADWVHPITSDYTMHWCASFTILLSAAALAKPPTTARKAWRLAHYIAAGPLVAGLIALALYELDEDVGIPFPQDFRYTVNTVADTKGATLLVSHESVGLIVNQACKLEFQRPACPFKLVVMQNPAQTDSWAFAASPSAPIPARAVPGALAGASEVFVFSRYVYTPLDQLKMSAKGYRIVAWDDGELIGPIPTKAFFRR